MTGGRRNAPFLKQASPIPCRACGPIGTLATTIFPNERKDSEMGWLFYTDGRVQTYADEKAEIARL